MEINIMVNEKMIKKKDVVNLLRLMEKSIMMVFGKMVKKSIGSEICLTVGE